LGVGGQGGESVKWEFENNFAGVFGATDMSGGGIRRT